MVLKYIAVVAASYLLGSFSLSIAVSKAVYGEDVRRSGSGNAGATNMARVFGISAGILTLLADMAKAAAAMLLGFVLLGEEGLAAAGMSCIFGHCYPVFYHFRGGKGVAVGAAVAFAIDWRVGVLAIAVFALTAGCTRKVSVGSICAAVAVLAGTVLLGAGEARVVLAVFCMCLVIIRHRENIKRLLNGTEPDFKPGKRTAAKE